MDHPSLISEQNRGIRVWGERTVIHAILIHADDKCIN